MQRLSDITLVKESSSTDLFTLAGELVRCAGSMHDIIGSIPTVMHNFQKVLHAYILIYSRIYASVFLCIGMNSFVLVYTRLYCKIL